MSTLDRYLFRQCLAGSVASLAVLLLVVSGLFFAELLGDAAGGDVPRGLLLALLGLRIPEAMTLVGPLALMAGLLLSLGRLGQQSELTVLRASGMPPARLLRPLLLLVLCWGLVMFGVTAWGTPAANRATNDLMNDVAREALLSGLVPGRFQRLDGGRLVVFVEGVDGSRGNVSGVFVQREVGERRELTTASEGLFWVDPESGDRYLSLMEGFQVEHGRTESDQRRMRFARYDIRLPPPVLVARRGGYADLDFPELLAQRDRGALVEIHSRLAWPVAAMLLGLLAVPLSLGEVRRGHHGRVVLALVFYLAYSNLLNYGVMAMEQGRLSSVVGVWPLHGALVVFLLLQWRGLYSKW